MANLKYKHTAYTSAQWASLNPVIVENEIVIESDTKRTKIGNGISTYNQLGYADANSVGNSLGSIKPTDAAPTPARNGNYTFSIGGNKPAWMTAEAGVTTVKAGDGVAVVYTAPSSYTYTHVNVSSEITNSLDRLSESINYQIIGSLYSKGAATASINNSIYIYDNKIQQSGTLKFRINAAVAFACRISLFTKSGGILTRRTYQDVNIAIGDNEITTTLVTQQGDYVGIIGVDAPLSFTYNHVSSEQRLKKYAFFPSNKDATTLNYATPSETDYRIFDFGFVVINTIDRFAYLEANKVGTTGDETIAGVKTFSSSPKVPTTPTDSLGAINNEYLRSKNQLIEEKMTHQIIGSLYSKGAATASINNSIYIYDNKIQQSGTLKFRINAAVAFACRISLFTKSGGILTRRTYQDVNVAIGDNEITTTLVTQVGDYVGIIGVDVPLSFTYSSAVLEERLKRYTFTGNKDTTTCYTISSTEYDARTFDFGFVIVNTIDFIKYFDSKIELSKSNLIKSNLLFDEKFNATASNNIVFSSGASYSANGLTISGIGQLITLNKYYSLGKRTARFTMLFSADSNINFTTNNNTFIATLNVSTKTVAFNNTSNSSHVFSNIDFNYLHIIELTRNYNAITLRIINLKTGVSDEFTVVCSGRGGEGAGVVNPQYNIVDLLHDMYALKLNSGGSVILKRLSVLCDVDKVDMIIYGDSISEPETYYPANDLSTSWTQLLVSELSNRGKHVICSGRGGTSINEIFTRIVNEVPYLRPKYVMVTIGTNGGNTIDKLKLLSLFCQEYNCTLLLNHIPCNESGTQVAVNSIIDTVRSWGGINGADFDIVTSVNYDGQVVDTNLMYWENYSGSNNVYHHPNPEGARRMFQKIKTDIPEIF